LVAGFTGDLVPFRADIGDQVKLAYAEHELRFVVATVTVTPCVLAELPSRLKMCCCAVMTSRLS
jgi:hypothetical protein